MRRLVMRLWASWFGETVTGVEAAAEEYRASAAGKRADWKTVWVLITAAVSLTGQAFWQQYVPLFEAVGWWNDLAPVVRVALTPGAADGGANPWRVPYALAGLVAFALGCVFWYVVPAVLVIKLALKERVIDYGVKLVGWSKGWKIYLVFVAVMVPLVLVFSGTEHFQRAYPFYRTWQQAEDGWGRLLAWEAAYALQFAGLEFFFRGFLVHGLKHRFGVYAVFVMTVPYCMIHFGKPLPECVASIVAGVALGLMSLKTRSVWLGAALHISVAWGMDSCSLFRKGAFTPFFG